MSSCHEMLKLLLKLDLHREDTKKKKQFEGMRVQ